jgi:hypothetical protein
MIGLDRIVSGSEQIRIGSEWKESKGERKEEKRKKESLNYCLN